MMWLAGCHVSQWWHRHWSCVHWSTWWRWWVPTTVPFSPPIGSANWERLHWSAMSFSLSLSLVHFESASIQTNHSVVFAPCGHDHTLTTLFSKNNSISVQQLLIDLIRSLPSCVHSRCKCPPPDHYNLKHCVKLSMRCFCKMFLAQKIDRNPPH